MNTTSAMLDSRTRKGNLVVVSRTMSITALHGPTAITKSYRLARVEKTNRAGRVQSVRDLAWNTCCDVSREEVLTIPASMTADILAAVGYLEDGAETEWSLPAEAAAAIRNAIRSAHSRN